MSRWTDELRGAPWSLAPTDEVASEELETRIAAEPVVPMGQVPPAPRAGRGPDPARRAVYVRRDYELAKYGYTPGCMGCDAAGIAV